MTDEGNMLDENRYECGDDYKTTLKFTVGAQCDTLSNLAAAAVEV